VHTVSAIPSRLQEFSALHLPPFERVFVQEVRVRSGRGVCQWRCSSGTEGCNGRRSCWDAFVLIKIGFLPSVFHISKLVLTHLYAHIILGELIFIVLEVFVLCVLAQDKRERVFAVGARPQALPVLLGNILDKHFAVKCRNDVNEVADGRFQHVVRTRRKKAREHSSEQVVFGDVAMVERRGLFDLDAREKEPYTRYLQDFFFAVAELYDGIDKTILEYEVLGSVTMIQNTVT